MKTFGGFRSGDEFFYGELRGDEVHRLSEPYWIQVQPTGEILPLANLQIDVPVAPSKLIAVGLNYADHIAEMKRTEIGAPLIWFKAPSSLLAHHGAIEVAFPEHQTEFEVELAVVIGSRTKKIIAAIQSGPFLVEGNKNIRGLNDAQLARRTFAGIATNDRAFLGVCSDVSLAQLANILATAPIAADSKIRRAMNLDGGSSSAFWFARENGSAFSISGRKPVRDFVGVVSK